MRLAAPVPEHRKGLLQQFPLCCPNARGAVVCAGMSPSLGTVPQPCRLGWSWSFALSSKSRQTLGGRTANPEHGLDQLDMERKKAPLCLHALGKAGEKK